MDKLPASTGWQWVRQGLQLFRSQPGGLSTLFLGYMFFMLALGILPVLGQVLPIILVPVFSIAFMRACAHIEQGKRVMPGLLFSGFRKPAFPALFTLGMLYLLVAGLALGGSALVDGGALFQLFTGQVEPSPELMKDGSMGKAVLLAIALYIPGAMAFCFAAPLIYWQNMSVGKAIFFSFFAVLRAFKAFAVFILGWASISILLSQLIIILFGRSQLAMMVMMPMSVIVTVMLHCSFYASYRQLFGSPAAEALAPAEPPAE
ncbi:hypothetical protein HSX11_26240 [Oxalobacteraceae bacterium]|nr:hypothetical protein [Oxalobacteraceae bacterium]